MGFVEGDVLRWHGTYSGSCSNHRERQRVTVRQQMTDRSMFIKSDARETVKAQQVVCCTRAAARGVQPWESASKTLVVPGKATGQMCQQGPQVKWANRFSWEHSTVDSTLGASQTRRYEVSAYSTSSESVHLLGTEVGPRRYATKLRGVSSRNRACASIAAGLNSIDAVQGLVLGLRANLWLAASESGELLQGRRPEGRSCSRSLTQAWRSRRWRALLTVPRMSGGEPC